MEKRRLGKTGHMSSVLTFGGAAVGHLTQAEAEAAADMAVGHGVNHFDIAPTYGESERLLGPWMQTHRKEIFLGCKTMERSKDRAYESLQRSLDLLQTDYFDLFQFHGVSDMAALDTVCGPDGALQAVLEAQLQGMVKHIGITGHCPPVHMEALNRFPFDTVLFPLNRVLAALNTEYSDFWPLLERAKKEDIGTITIKAIARKPWNKSDHDYSTWYQPYNDQENIDKSIWFALSQGVTTLPMASDVSLWPMIFSAVERYHELDSAEQGEVVSEITETESIFPIEVA